MLAPRRVSTGLTDARGMNAFAPRGFRGFHDDAGSELVDSQVRAAIAAAKAGPTGVTQAQIIAHAKAIAPVDTLYQGQTVVDALKNPPKKGEFPALVSQNARFRLVVQSDGNMVLLDRDRNPGRPFWASNTGHLHPRNPANGRPSTYLLMQSDGNLVLYDQYDGNESPDVLWKTNTAGQRLGTSLVMQNDGNLVLYYAKNPIWATGTIDGQIPTRSALSSLGSALSSVGSTVYSTVSAVGKPLVSIATSPIRLTRDIAGGRNIYQSFKADIQQNLRSAGQIAPYAQAVLSVVPGIGSGINAAIAAGAALAHGQSISDALAAGVKNALPGGPLAAAAFDTAYGLARGKSFSDAALEAARANIPTDLGKKAFDVGLALAHGANLQKTLLAAAPKALASIVPLQNMAQSAHVAFSTLQGSVGLVATALVKNPALRGLPIGELAKKLNVGDGVARDAVAAFVASVANQAKAGQKTLSIMANPQIAARLSTAMTTDQALAQFASFASLPVGTTSAIRRSLGLSNVRWRALPGQHVTYLRRKVPAVGRLSPGAIASVQNLNGSAQGMNDAGAFESNPTIRQGSSGPAVKDLQTALRIPADGKFGPQTKTAVVAFQKAQRLTADGVVGPKTWAALSSATSPAPVPVLSTSTSTPGQTNPIAAPIVASSPMRRAPGSSKPTLRQGATGPYVTEVQTKLAVRPVDGKFGPVTRAAVVRFQTVKRLKADGIVGPQTWAALDQTAAPAAASAPAPTATTPAPVSTPHILQAQMLLAGWAADNGVAYGTIADLSGLEDARFHQTLAQFQTAAKVGATKGDLDAPTYDALVRYIADRAGTAIGQVAQGAVPTLPGMPGPNPTALPGITPSSSPDASPAPSSSLPLPGLTLPADSGPVTVATPTVITEQAPGATLPGIPGPNPSTLPGIQPGGAAPAESGGGMAAIMGLAAAAALAMLSS